MPPKATPPSPPNALDAAGPAALAIYRQLLKELHEIGAYEVEIKKTSIHLVRKTAFAGVAPRKSHLILTVKSDRPLESPRIFKSEQTSASRWHHEVKLTEPEQIDAELLGWLRAGYEISG